MEKLKYGSIAFCTISDSERSFRWERSFYRSYCHKNVTMDGNPFRNSKMYNYLPFLKFSRINRTFQL